jgi:hypothetical protein
VEVKIHQSDKSMKIFLNNALFWEGTKLPGEALRYLLQTLGNSVEFQEE